MKIDLAAPSHAPPAFRCLVLWGSGTRPSQSVHLDTGRWKTAVATHFFCCSLLTIIVWTILRYGHISTGRGFGKRWYISGLLAVDCTIFHDCCHELHARDVCWHLPPQVSKVRSIVWYWSSRRVGLKVCQRFAFWDSSSGLVWKNCLFWRWEIGKMWIVEIWGDFDECCRVSGKVLGFLVGWKG